MASAIDIMMANQPGTNYAVQQAAMGDVGTAYAAAIGRGGAKAPTGWLGKGKGLLSGEGIKGALPYILLYYLFNKATQGAQEQAGMRMQAEGMEQQASMISPEALMYQAMAGPAQAEEQGMRAAMVNQLLGTTGPSLARGEQKI